MFSEKGGGVAVAKRDMLCYIVKRQGACALDAEMICQL